MKERGEGEVESTGSANADMPVEKILEAEIAVEPKYDSYAETQVSMGEKLFVKASLMGKKIINSFEIGNTL